MIIQFFGKRQEGEGEREDWRVLAENLPRLAQRRLRHEESDYEHLTHELARAAALGLAVVLSARRRQSRRWRRSRVPEPSRIASIGGSITEIVYALGEEGKLVARDSTSLYPGGRAQAARCRLHAPAVAGRCAVGQSDPASSRSQGSGPQGSDRRAEEGERSLHRGAGRASTTKASSTRSASSARRSASTPRRRRSPQRSTPSSRRPKRRRAAIPQGERKRVLFILIAAGRQDPGLGQRHRRRRHHRAGRRRQCRRRLLRLQATDRRGGRSPPGRTSS